ncbi:isoprenyl transferase [Bacteroidia bacterium]|nr:isoprenyl transferase [Bacteroidia bacterium]MDB4107012.1 isoprenyl transferase [Bacteroidia bacterium]MDB9882471.1 isoprenyl transferase [Bacteroidia bacterium]
MSKEKIVSNRLPRHIAIIMDGNGRWAKEKGRFRVFGHENGVKAVRDVSEGCAELGVECLTLYAFSTENWNRPKMEVNALMTLLVKTIKSETKTLMKNGIKLDAIGDRSTLPKDCLRELDEAIEMTKDNTRMTLILALSYSAKWDIVNATKTIAQRAKDGEIRVEDINEELINNTLTTHKYPHPELMIRTSGELRISNFLLWEIAYSELYFTTVLWPDYRKEHLYEAILEYQSRERRFGKTSEQLA